MTRWLLDPGSSHVRIDARSNVHPVHVDVDGVTGHVDAVVADGEVVAISGAQVEVAASRLESGNPLVDRETRRRIDARRHPTIVGQMTSAEPRGGGRFALTGEISFVGSVQPVAGDVTTLVEDGRVIVEGEQTFDVRDWGLQPPRLLVLRVEPLVTVRLSVRARRVAH